MDQSSRTAQAVALAAPSSQDSVSDDRFSPPDEARLYQRITVRLVPLLFLCYVIAYIDRINVGFAKLQLQGVLGVDPAVFGRVYGLGAGLFFVGYFIFEVPSNLILHRVGARLWIARIMIFWGLVSVAFIFMKGVTSFYLLRFFLGAAEAGFFPGVILYFTYWYPPEERARIIALFAIGGVAAGVIGSPISGLLLEMDGLGGLAGWQWLFLLESVPAIALGFVVLFALPDRPSSAHWLTTREKKWIEQRISITASHGISPSTRQSHNLRDCFSSPIVWLLCLIYFLRNMASYGCEMWLPTMVKGLSGKGDALVGVINTIPYIGAGVIMYLGGRHSDKTGERRGHVAAGAVLAMTGFAMAATASNPYTAVAGLTLAFAGSKATLPPFWALTTTFLRGTAAAGGIALINSVGNLGGFVGPTIMGVMKDKTGSNSGGLILLGLCYFTVAALAFIVPKSGEASRER